jgi:hypothetical protein
VSCFGIVIGTFVVGGMFGAIIGAVILAMLAIGKRSDLIEQDYHDQRRDHPDH